MKHRSDCYFKKLVGYLLLQVFLCRLTKPAVLATANNTLI